MLRIFKMPVKIYGFATNMPELMSASDLMITKSGGLTTSEALAMDLPMIIIRPVIGQETKNCDFLIRHDAAVRIDDVKKIRKVAEDLFYSKEKLERMRKDVTEIARPDSSMEIARFVAGKYL